MSHSRDPASYTDIRPVLDQALQRGGARYTVENYGRAVAFRAKSHVLRSLLREQAAQALAARGHHGVVATTPYDSMKLYIEHEPAQREYWKLVRQGKEPEKECTVRIEFPRPKGLLQDLDGNEVKLNQPIISDLIDVADDFMKGFVDGLDSVNKP